jgi:hypothetical protein
MNEPALRTPEDIYRENIGEASKNLFNKTVTVANCKTTLYALRKDRNAVPEAVQDAAINFRKAEGELQMLLGKMVDIHVEFLHTED